MNFGLQSVENRPIISSYTSPIKSYKTYIKSQNSAELATFFTHLENLWDQDKNYQETESGVVNVQVTEQYLFDNFYEVLYIDFLPLVRFRWRHVTSHYITSRQATFFSWLLTTMVVRTRSYHRNKGQASYDFIKTLHCKARAAFVSDFRRDNTILAHVNLSVHRWKLFVWKVHFYFV